MLDDSYVNLQSFPSFLTNALLFILRMYLNINECFGTIHPPLTHVVDKAMHTWILFMITLQFPSYICSIHFFKYFMNVMQ